MDILKLFKWKILGKENLHPRSVIIIAPHTSMWDGFYGLLAMRSLGINYKVLAAEWLFNWWPMSWIMKDLLHAIPVNHKNTIQKAIKLFENKDENVNLIICPEGTRSPVEKWNRGYKIISERAEVPVDAVIVNYRNKTFTIVDGNRSLKDIYKNCEGIAKHPNKFKLPL